MKHTLIEKLISRIPKHPNSDAKVKEKKQLNYFFVSTKVVTYKDANNVEHRGIVGVTYVKEKE